MTVPKVCLGDKEQLIAEDYCIVKPGLLYKVQPKSQGRVRWRSRWALTAPCYSPSCTFQPQQWHQWHAERTVTPRHAHSAPLKMMIDTNHLYHKSLTIYIRLFKLQTIKSLYRRWLITRHNGLSHNLSTGHEFVNKSLYSTFCGPIPYRLIRVVTLRAAGAAPVGALTYFEVVSQGGPTRNSNA